jgi:hypothetical protein
MPGIRRLLGALGDGFRVIGVLPVVEFGRRKVGPSSILRLFRACGARRQFRSTEERLRLRRIIGAFDARLPDGGDCYRRVLFEILLDPVSASEPVHFGIQQHGGPKSGHAWLGEAETLPAVYDVVFSM